jgi:alanyl-tRNA synthetase
MQFDRDASGKLTPLPRPSIDTGMGLERTSAVIQGVLSNYDTDLLRPIIDRAGELIGKSYGEDERSDTILRINADHVRATAFLINDGVLPSNEGRGYVLRKIMRRAMRNARMAGASEPYLYKLTGFVAELMRDAYPEMMESVPMTVCGGCLGLAFSAAALLARSDLVSSRLCCHPIHSSTRAILRSVWGPVTKVTSLR